MKCTKTILAVAIAGIAAMPMIASADTTLSGVVALKLQGNDGDNGDLTLDSDDTLMGVVAEHELNSGLTGYGSLRYDIDGFSGAGVTGDNVYVGIKGGFGDVRIGEIPLASEYGQKAGDLHDQTGSDVNAGISYTGTFGPAGIGVYHALETNNDVDYTEDNGGAALGARSGVGATFSLGGFGIGVGAESREDETNASVGASFGLAGASVAVHYVVKQPDGAGDDATVIAAKVGYTFGDVGANLTFSQSEEIAGHESKIRLDLSYGLGGGMTLSSRINMNSDHTDGTTDDVTDYRVMLAKSF